MPDDTPNVKPAEPGVLVMTVGQGKLDDLESTILQPFQRSIEDGNWKKIVLLPSSKTEENARAVASKFGTGKCLVRTLLRDDDEDNTDRCFEHFNELLMNLIHEGHPPESITADVTRGTKAMTAALAMAAMAHRIGCIRFISGERDKNGTVKPGSERIIDIAPRIALLQQDLNLAAGYLRAGNYRAVENLLTLVTQKGAPGKLKDQIRWYNWAAQLWGSWDRFDYKSAWNLAQLHNMPKKYPRAVSDLLPAPEQLRALQILAGPAAPDAKDNSRYCRVLAADLLANAERRLHEGQNEEVLVRLYRVVELIGQIRLFEHGIDTAEVHAKREIIQKWLADLPPNARPVPDEKGRLALAREKAAQLLLYLETSAKNQHGIAIAQKLADLQWLGEWGPTMRNRSILIHGFKARSRGKEKELERLLDELTRFYCDEHPENPALLESCRFRFLTWSKSSAASAAGPDNTEMPDDRGGKDHAARAH